MNEAFDDKIIYKLAIIETQVKGIADNLISAVHRLEDKISDGQKQAAMEVAKIDARITTNEKRLIALENYKTQLVARVGGVVSVAAIFWALFGKVLEDKVTSIF